MATVRSDLWAYRNSAWTSANLVGYGVEAQDGSIGKIDEASFDVGAGYVVVDTGPWIFGKKVMLPAGVITSVNTADRTVAVNRTKDQIRNAPEFHDDEYKEESYRSGLGAYYDAGGAG